MRDTETLCSNGSYFKCEKGDSNWNLCRQRITLQEEMVELNQFEVDDQVIKMNKLQGIIGI